MKSSDQTTDNQDSRLQPFRTAEVLEFFDDLGVFAELEVVDLPTITACTDQDAPASFNHTPTMTSAPGAPEFQSLSVLLASEILPVENKFSVGALGPMESRPQLHMHEDDFDALSIEAASDSLALHQELRWYQITSEYYDSEPSSVASEPTARTIADATETEITSRPTTKANKKQKKSTSQRQKEELSYLRGKLDEYEHELKKIALETKDVVSAAVAQADTWAVESDSTVARAQSLWEVMAKRQREEKNRAELENATLKQKMEAQLKFAKSLERMLRKRRVWGGLQETAQQRFMTLSVKDSEVFEALRSRIEARTKTVDDVFAAHGLSERSPPKRDTSIAFVDDEGMRIEFLHSTDAPFEMRAVSSVVWKYLQKRELKLNNLGFTTQIMEQTEDFLLSTQRVTSSAPSDARDITVHSAFKRIHQDHRILFIWESLTESKSFASRGRPAAQLVSRGCGQILRRLDVQSGHESSILQSFVSVVPTLNGEEEVAVDGSSPSHGREEQSKFLGTGLISELTISAYEQNAQTVRQAIENALIDDLLAQ